MNDEQKVTASGRPAETEPSRGVPTGKKLSDGQFADHWVLSEDERHKGFIRPVRRSYVHNKCGIKTTMGISIAETYARNPRFYGSTFCCGCGDYFPVGADGQFRWHDSLEKVGT